jgi:hypothetical protein
MPFCILRVSFFFPPSFLADLLAFFTHTGIFTRTGLASYTGATSRANSLPLALSIFYFFSRLLADLNLHLASPPPQLPTGCNAVTITPGSVTITTEEPHVSGYDYAARE